MKKKLFILAILLTGSFTIYAGQGQNNKGHDSFAKGQRASHHREQMINDLNLTESQIKSFDAIMQNKRDKMKAAKELIHADTQAELSQVLSAEQMQMLEDKKQNRKDRAKKRMRKHMKEIRKKRNMRN
ncbi:MAG: hypothetical protein AB8B80_13285 [Marinicellaceae bacterium]